MRGRDMEQHTGNCPDLLWKVITIWVKRKEILKGKNSWTPASSKENVFLNKQSINHGIQWLPHLWRYINNEGIPQVPKQWHVLWGFLSGQKKIKISQESSVHMKCTIAFFPLGQLNLALIFTCFSVSHDLIVINWS